MLPPPAYIFADKIMYRETVQRNILQISERNSYKALSQEKQTTKIPRKFQGVRKNHSGESFILAPSGVHSS